MLQLQLLNSAGMDGRFDAVVRVRVPACACAAAQCLWRLLRCVGREGKERKRMM